MARKNKVSKKEFMELYDGVEDLFGEGSWESMVETKEFWKQKEWKDLKQNLKPAFNVLWDEFAYGKKRSIAPVDRAIKAMEAIIA